MTATPSLEASSTSYLRPWTLATFQQRLLGATGFETALFSWERAVILGSSRIAPKGVPESLQLAKASYPRKADMKIAAFCALQNLAPLGLEIPVLSDHS